MTAVWTPGIRPGLNDFDVRIARSREEFSGILRIREIVFRDEQGIVDALVTDSDDRVSVHAYAVEAGETVAIGRLTPPNRRRPEGQIAWVATLPEYRRQGFSSAVMEGLIEIADRDGYPSILLSAQTYAMPFYHQFGFLPYGARFEVRGIEHQYMERLPIASIGR